MDFVVLFLCPVGLFGWLACVKVGGSLSYNTTTQLRRAHPIATSLSPVEREWIDQVNCLEDQGLLHLTQSIIDGPWSAGGYRATESKISLRNETVTIWPRAERKMKVGSFAVAVEANPRRDMGRTLVLPSHLAIYPGVASHRRRRVDLDQPWPQPVNGNKSIFEAAGR